MSRTAGLLQFDSLRIAYWIELVSQAHGGARPKIDSDFCRTLGITFPPGQRLPRWTESFREGHVPRVSLRGLGIDDYVKAGTRMLGDNTAEKAFYSLHWRTVLPKRRTARDVAREIQHVLRHHKLCRLPEDAVAELLRWRFLCADRMGHVPSHLTGEFSINQLIGLRQQGLLPIADWSVLVVLLHQEAFLSCQHEHADRLYALCFEDAIATVRKFFASAPEWLQEGARNFENALFYPDTELAGGPSEVSRRAKHVRGLVLPHVRDDRGRWIRRPSSYEIWKQLGGGREAGRGLIGGTG